MAHLNLSINILKLTFSFTYSSLGGARLTSRPWGPKLHCPAPLASSCRGRASRRASNMTSAFAFPTVEALSAAIPKLEHHDTLTSLVPHVATIDV